MNQEDLDAATRANVLRAQAIFHTLTPAQKQWLKEYRQSDLLRKYLTAAEKNMVKALVAKKALAKDKFFAPGNPDNGRLCYEINETVVNFIDREEGENQTGIDKYLTEPEK